LAPVRHPDRLSAFAPHWRR